MLNTKNKFLLLGLTALIGLNGITYVNSLKTNGTVNAGIIAENNDYSDLTTSYFKIEGMVGDVITDFVVDYRTKTVNSYTVITDGDAIVKTNKGLELKKSGDGVMTIKYAESTVMLDYSIEKNPSIPEEDANKSESDAPTTANFKTCTITSNGEPAKGIIMYIDDSKNAFKSTGKFYIEESFLDGKTHTIYIAKFTTKGPVAYAVTQFTSLANEVNFMNYNETDVEINNLNLNLKTDLNKLF